MSNEIKNAQSKNSEKKQNKIAMWWSSLKKPAKIAICSGGAVALASAIIFPTLAATVWKKENRTEINLNFTKIGTEKQYCTGLSLTKGTKYVFKANMNEFTSLNTKHFEIYLEEGESNASSYVTDKYITDFALKTNTKTFKKLEKDSNPGTNEYCLKGTGDDSYYRLGTNSVSNDDTLIGTFTALENGSNLNFSVSAYTTY